MSSKGNKSRRDFLKGAGVAGLATSLGASRSPAVPSNTGVVSQSLQSRKSPARNLIFLVVDGMCNGTLGFAHHWNLRNKKVPLNWMQLYERPGLRRSFQDTASNSSPVTDSAAAASAWGCGQRVNNGSINVTPEGAFLTPLYTRAKQAGKRTGLVTTCRISHATPAGFAANTPDRDLEDVILGQYLDRGVDLLFGGGAEKFYPAAADGNKPDYFAQFAEAGYHVIRSKEQLAGAVDGDAPLLGIFSDSHIPYALDRKNDASLSNVPGLVAMFDAALKRLEGAEDGFVLQVEAGRVDHAGHVNDAGAILHEQLEFDACIPLALNFIEKHPDTMLIVTTDHGTGGCQLDGSGIRYSESGPALDRVNQFRYSFEWLEQRFRAANRFNALPFRLATGLTATADQEAAVQAALADPGVKYLNSKMTSIFEDELNAVCSVGWSSNMHTSENVELLSFGPGSELVPNYIHNNELFGIMTEALGI